MGNDLKKAMFRFRDDIEPSTFQLVALQGDLGGSEGLPGFTLATEFEGLPDAQGELGVINTAEVAGAGEILHLATNRHWWCQAVEPRLLFCGRDGRPLGTQGGTAGHGAVDRRVHRQ